MQKGDAPAPGPAARVLIDEPAQGAQLSRWLEAGRADWVIDGRAPDN